MGLAALIGRTAPVGDVPASLREVADTEVVVGPEGEGQTSLLLAEEFARTEKRSTVVDRVQVRTVTREIEELVGETLAREDLEIERVAIGRDVTEAPAIRQEGDVTIIPVLEEVLVVEKRLVLKEEIHIRRTRRSERVQTPIVLRKQEAVVERLDADESETPDRPET